MKDYHYIKQVKIYQGLYVKIAEFARKHELFFSDALEVIVEAGLAPADADYNKSHHKAINETN